MVGAQVDVALGLGAAAAEGQGHCRQCRDHHQAAGRCQERAWFGWPCDEELERLRNEYALATSPEAQISLAKQIQKRAYEVVTYVNFGEFNTPYAYRNNLTGLLSSPVPFFWNVEKQ